MKAAIIGGGNIGLALAEGLIRAGVCKAGDITITRRNPASLEAYAKKGFLTGTDNALAVQGAETIFICVLPQQLDEALTQLKPAHSSSPNIRFIFCTACPDAPFNKLSIAE